MAYQRVLVGTDYSDASLEAARLAMRLGDETTRVRVARVTPFIEMPAQVDINATLQRSNLYAWCDKAGITTREQVLLYGSSAHELAREATSMQADLVVVGHTGGSRLAHALLGSVARSLARIAPCDTLVVRGSLSAAGPPFRSILVATDLYEPSARAAKRAKDVAKACGASLAIVHAIDPDLWQHALRMPPGTLANASDWVDQTYGDMLHKFNAEHLGGEAKEILTHGHPAKAVADEARAIRADLVVVGTHGARGIERLLLGAHAEAIVERAPCSVLVVR